MPFWVREDDKRPMIHTPFWSFLIPQPPAPTPIEQHCGAKTMTKDEADEKVRAAKEAVIDALRPGPTPLSVYRRDDPIRLAWDRLYEAEAARAALDKPRLMPIDDFLRRWATSRDYHALVRARELDILAQAEKLPRLSQSSATAAMTSLVYPDGRIIPLDDAICLSDLRNLIQGT